jgi:hypothetical protein
LGLGTFVTLKGACGKTTTTTLDKSGIVLSGNFYLSKHTYFNLERTKFIHGNVFIPRKKQWATGLRYILDNIY